MIRQLPTLSKRTVGRMAVVAGRQATALNALVLDYGTHVETAAKTADAQAFMDALGYLVFPYLYDKDKTDPAVLQSMDEATAFVTSHKLGVPKWNKIRRMISNDEFDDALDSVVEFADNLRAKAEQIKADPALTTDEVGFIKDWQLFMRVDSAPAVARMDRNAGKVLSPAVAKHFRLADAPDNAGHQDLATDIVGAAAQAKTLAAQLLGLPLTKAPSVMSIDQAKAAREDDPALYKQYQAARLIVNSKSREIIARMSRAAGGPVDATAIRKQFKTIGLEAPLAPEFVGKVDEGGYYSIFGEKLNAKPIGTVMMNPDYTAGDGRWVAKYKAPGAKVWQYAFAEKALKERRAQKFADIGDTIEIIDTARAKWLRLMMGSSTDKEAALMIELVYWTQSRIGSEGNSADGENTYGLTTLEARHTKITGKTARFTYLGKSGVQQTHLLEGDDKYHTAIIKYLAERKAECEKPTDRIFETKAREVNALIKKCGLKITVRRFRTLRATVLMGEELEKATTKLGKNPTEKAVKDAFVAASEVVGGVLGHMRQGEIVTGQTAIKNYISPSIMLAFFQKYSVRPPRILEMLEE